MKSFVLFCAFAVFLATVQSFPADSERFNPDRDIEELPAGSYPMEPPSGMDGFLGGFNDMFERMRQQMLHLLSIVPRIGGEVPEGGNTTSVTKIIGGHKVVVNETVYTSGNGEGSGAVFKVRVVDIHPSEGESDESSVNSADPARSVESVENSNANEIPNSLGNSQQKRKVNNMDLLETNYDGLESFGYPNENVNNAWSSNQDNDIETFDDIDAGIDLSNDIYNNAEARPQHPDTELFEVRPGHDLSGDTYVNAIAAQNNWPVNPHAEFIGPASRFNARSQSIQNAYSPGRQADFSNEYAPVYRGFQDRGFANFYNSLREGPSAEFVSQYGPSRQALRRDPSNPYYYRIENS